MDQEVKKEKRQKYVEMLSKVAPGTPLREGIDSILDGQLGALIVLGNSGKIEKMIDGGFELDCEFTPERLFELSKMDGAIILDEDCENIHYANVHLQVDRSYETDESGTRHRTADRAAKESGHLVIAISERRHNVLLYQDEYKCKMKSLSSLLEEASQTVKTMESYRNVLTKYLSSLDMRELDDEVTLEDVAGVLQRFEMLIRVNDKMKECLAELGDDAKEHKIVEEAKLIKSQADELMEGIVAERRAIFSDYYNGKDSPMPEFEQMEQEMGELDDEYDIKDIISVLNYARNTDTSKEVKPSGFRMLGKVPKLVSADIIALVQEYGTLSDLVSATQEEIIEQTGLSRSKVRGLKKGLNRMKYTIEMDRGDK